MDTTIKAKLVGRKKGIYSNYVFEDLENSRYIMCTVLPNWDMTHINLGDIGFLTYEEAIAGQQYTTSELETGTYKYSKLYFKDFVIDKKEQENLVL